MVLRFLRGGAFNDWLGTSFVHVLAMTTRRRRWGHDQAVADLTRVTMVTVSYINQLKHILVQPLYSSQHGQSYDPAIDAFGI